VEPSSLIVAHQELVHGTENARIIRNSNGFDGASRHIPILAISDARFLNRSLRRFDDPIGTLLKTGFSITDSARYFILDEPFEPIIRYFISELCILAASEDKEFKSQRFAMIERVFAELRGCSMKFRRVERDGSGYQLFIETDETEGHIIPIQKASQGTLSILVIFGLIYSYLEQLCTANKVQKNIADICNVPGIVVIEELDAHLHPSWQSVIIDLLRKTFPNVQFIISAHNPVVVVGREQDEVCVMYRAKQGFKLARPEFNYKGACPNELYRLLFGVEDLDPGTTRNLMLYNFRDEIYEKISELASSISKGVDENISISDFHSLVKTIKNIDKAKLLKDESLLQTAEKISK
jgi:hypothetical protein